MEQKDNKCCSILKASSQSSRSLGAFHLLVATPGAQVVERWVVPSKNPCDTWNLCTSLPCWSSVVTRMARCYTLGHAHCPFHSQPNCSLMTVCHLRHQHVCSNILTHSTQGKNSFCCPSLPRLQTGQAQGFFPLLPSPSHPTTHQRSL